MGETDLQFDTHIILQLLNQAFWQLAKGSSLGPLAFAV